MLSEDSRLEAMADGADMSGVDENDPRSVARWARKMGQQLGEDELGEDFDQVVDEMEQGGMDNGGAGAEEEEDGDL